jgi:formate hydrogenlyase subunit 3/multisubunit Na+/H+ antiporter MnhD subunit
MFQAKNIGYIITLLAAAIMLFSIIYSLSAWYHQGEITPKARLV